MQVVNTVLLSLLSFATAQQATPASAPAAEGSIANLKSMLPKLDAKAVASANQQMQSAGISDICAQSLVQVASMFS